MIGYVGDVEGVGKRDNGRRESRSMFVGIGCQGLAEDFWRLWATFPFPRVGF